MILLLMLLLFSLEHAAAASLIRSLHNQRVQGIQRSSGQQRIILGTCCTMRLTSRRHHVLRH